MASLPPSELVAHMGLVSRALAQAERATDPDQALRWEREARALLAEVCTEAVREQAFQQLTAPIAPQRQARKGLFGLFRRPDPLPTCTS